MKITIDNDIAAPVAKVWKYYTEPSHITKWNFASDDWHSPEARNDLRIGGKYYSRMEAKDGTLGFDFEAVYDEVEEMKKIVYTMGDGRQVTTSFEDLGDNTSKITTTFDPEDQNAHDLQRSGWQAILDNFKKHVETD